MTVTKIYSPTRTTGNGSTDEFTADWQVTDETDVDVYLIDTGATTNKTLQTITTHYTVTINETTENATITFVTPPPSTKDVILERSIPNTQVEDIPDVATVRENQIEDPLDRNTMLIQQLEEKLGRKFGASVADDTNLTTTYDLPTPVNNRALFWSLSGSVASIVNSSTDLSDIDASVTAAAASETNAATSETNAAASAAAASTSETNAAASATAASQFSQSNDMKWSCTSATAVVVTSGSEFRGTLTGTKFTFDANKTFDITGTAGTIGALDQGAEASSTHYYLIALGDSTDVTAPNIIAVSKANYASWTVSNLTGNYAVFDDFKRIGVVYNDGSSDLQQGYYDKGTFYYISQNANTASTGSASFTNIDFSTALDVAIVSQAFFGFSIGAAGTVFWRIDTTSAAGTKITDASATGGGGQVMIYLLAGIFEAKSSSGTVTFELNGFLDDLQTEK